MSKIISVTHRNTIIDGKYRREIIRLCDNQTEFFEEIKKRTIPSVTILKGNIETLEIEIIEMVSYKEHPEYIKEVKTFPCGKDVFANCMCDDCCAIGEE